MKSNRKRFLIFVILCMAISMATLTGCGENKAKKQASQYMQEKYGEEFEVDEVWENLNWYAHLRSEKHPEYLITARFNLNRPETLSDDYVQKCVYGNFSKEIQSIVKMYFPRNFIHTANGYDTYYDFGNNIDMSMQEMNTRCPHFFTNVYIEKSDFSLQKAYNMMSSVRAAYPNLSGSIIVTVVEDEKLNDEKELVMNGKTGGKYTIASSQFGAMNFDGEQIEYKDFVKKFNDWGGALE